jgi:hypothetical protein
MSNPEPNEPDWKDKSERGDIEELHAQVRSILGAVHSLAVAEHRPDTARDVIADTLDLIRDIAEMMRRNAVLLRRQPTLTDHVADDLEKLANVLDPLPRDEDK